MIIGSRAIIVDVDEARKILDAVRLDWDKNRIERLIKFGLIDSVNALDRAIKDLEETSYD